ncbi:MAG: trigger factor [Pyrinomonadaceae bacterium]|nr:trigger factor [Pyrinomonadaceae bacterium]
MKTELVDISPTRKELKIEIDAAAISTEYDRVSDRYAKAANVPGFRRGHAPRNIVRQRFKNEIRAEVLQHIVPQAISAAITESSLAVIGEPDVRLDNDAALDKFGEQPIALHAHVEVLPDIALGQYKGLEAARRTRPITEEMVEETIRELREESSSLQPVEDRGAQSGDIVTVNFRGRFIDPPAEEDITVDEVDVEIGGPGVVQDFNDHLLGTRPDDERTFTVKYPEDFSSKGLAGKEIEYTAVVTAVRVKEVPELDDEWAKGMGEKVDSVEGLRAHVRQNLTESAQRESDFRLRNELMDKLVAAHQFEVPTTLVEHQTQQLLESTVRDMLQRGVDPREREVNWEGLRDMLRARATEDLRGSLLLERVADEERIEVTDEEVAAEISSFAEATHQSIDQVRAALTKQGGERSIADRLRNRKAFDLLIENASVRDEEWREEEVEAKVDETPVVSGTSTADQLTAESSNSAVAGDGESRPNE